MGQKEVSTKEVLKIMAVGGLVVSAVLFPGLPTGLIKTYKAFKKFNKKDLGRIIKRLEKQEMVSFIEAGSKTKIELTQKGKNRLLEYDFENIEIKNKRIDGKFRLVIFDIPETKKNARDVFRRKLLQLGFVKLQQSVFVSAYPCKNEVDFLANFLEISDFITIVVVDKIERGEQLFFKKYN